MHILNIINRTTVLLQKKRESSESTRVAAPVESRKTSCVAGESQELELSESQRCSSLNATVFCRLRYVLEVFELVILTDEGWSGGWWETARADDGRTSETAMIVPATKAFLCGRGGKMELFLLTLRTAFGEGGGRDNVVQAGRQSQKHESDPNLLSVF